MRVRLIALGAALALGALLAPAAQAGPAEDYTAIRQNWIANGADAGSGITPCRFRQDQIAAARTESQKNTEDDYTRFRDALKREYDRQQAGGCISSPILLPPRPPSVPPPVGGSAGPCSRLSGSALSACYRNLRLLAELAACQSKSGRARKDCIRRVTDGGNGDGQGTQLISRSLDGGIPNGPSTNAVISSDLRYAKLIAFESDASDLVAGDGNRFRDVFAIQRGGSYRNNGSPWRAGKTYLVSRGIGGQDANGPSWHASVDGSFTSRASCVGFLSAASNLVRGDTNGKVDAFVAELGGAVQRVSLPGGRQSSVDASDVAVSGDCTKVAFVAGGSLYVRSGRNVKELGPGADPSWSTGKAAESDLVYTGTRGVALSDGGTRKGKLVVPGGRNPAYNNIKRQVVAYERRRGGATQVLWKDLGRRERAASVFRRSLGNAESRNPVIGNSGFYIAFESSASNLQTDASGRRGDYNGASDVYLFTDARDITILQSVQQKGVALPGGGKNPGMSFYANYIVFDSPALLSITAPRQVFMRYLGPV